MVLLAMLRHGDTAWSAESRMQGRSDVPLSDAGRSALRNLALPPACQGMRVVTSPLVRCVETAALLGAANATREPCLIEMSWGEWEGRRLAEVRQVLGAAMAENEARGWDFRPAKGESPREVLARLRPWLARLDAPTLAITHRGVIRAVFAAASRWNMVGKPPVKLDWNAVHLFRIGAGGEPMIEALNLR